MTELKALRRFVGHDVDVEWRGTSTRGRLLNVSGRSLWLVAGDEDTIIPLGLVVALRAVSPG
jgi:hypothetical protein